MKLVIAALTTAALATSAAHAQAAAQPAATAPSVSATATPRGERSGALSLKVLDYITLMKSLVAQAKQPGFTAESWAPLAKLVAVDEFKRIGAFKEEMDWRQYTEFLTKWAKSSGHDNSVRRITEVPGLVFLELEERNGIGDKISVVNSLSVFEFNQDGKIRHLDIYLQRSGQ